MTQRLPLILQIQADAADSSTSTLQVVRTAKIAASKLGLTDAIEWIDNELNGYYGPTADKVPDYRIAVGECLGWNPFNGWLPVIIPDPELQKLISTAHIRQPLASIEDIASDTDASPPVMPYPPEVQHSLRKLTGTETKFQLRLSRPVISHILNGVRQLALDWSLELESAGILGENMSFKKDEQNAAQALTQTVFVQNAGIIGGVSDQATVSISQTANINVEQAKDVLSQCRSLLHGLPEQIRVELQPVIDEANTHLSQAQPDQGTLRRLLTSIRTICEGAAGNVLAAGIVASITTLL